MGAYLRIGFVAKATATMPPNYSKTALNLELADFYPQNYKKRGQILKKKSYLCLIIRMLLHCST